MGYDLRAALYNVIFSCPNDYCCLDEKKWNPSNFLRPVIYISDSHKYNFQLSSIHILVLVRPSWFCCSERAFSDQLRPHLLEFALQSKRYKSEQNGIIWDKQIFVVRIGNLIVIWFFYKIHFSPIELLFKCQEMAEFKQKYP